MMRQHWLGSVSFFMILVASPVIAQSGLRPLTLGQPLQGSMGPEDPVLDSDDSSYELFQVQAPKGQMVTVTLSSTAFQPIVAVGDEIDEECEGCTASVGETDKPAVVRRIVPASGLLQVRANTMNKGERGAFTILATASQPPPISARPLPFGQSVSDSLDVNDAVTSEGATVDAYALRLNAEQEVQLDLSSDDFDPKLELLTPAGAKVAEDDDGGPGTSARIRYVVPRAGLYQVRVMAVGSGSVGTYTLTTGLRQELPPMPAPLSIDLGQAVTGAMSNTTPRYETDGEETQAVRYGLRLEGGKAYRIALNAANGSELDPKISIGRILADGSLESLAQDDDGGGGRNALLRFRPETSGTYVVEVQKVGRANGLYRLVVEQAAAGRAPAATQAMRLGQNISGELRDGGARLTATDSLFNTYSIALRAGQKVNVKMDKEGDANLDPLLEIGLLTSAVFEALAKDDDGGQGLNARIKFTAPSDGTYIIRAMAGEPTQEGQYTVGVSDVPVSVVPPIPARAKLGETIRGNLDANDPLRNDSHYFDRYVFDGQIGETFEIAASADNFDIIVGARQIDRVDDDYASDDDSGGGTNAKLIYTVTTAGPQVIRVTTVEESAEGDYSLVIIKK
ncbi:Peptidase, C-terminal, archaeal/bacterial [Caulobacteraceae bacterium]